MPNLLWVLQNGESMSLRMRFSPPTPCLSCLTPDMWHFQKRFQLAFKGGKLKQITSEVKLKTNSYQSWFQVLLLHMLGKHAMYATPDGVVTIFCNQINIIVASSLPRLHRSVLLEKIAALEFAEVLHTKTRKHAHFCLHKMATTCIGRTACSPRMQGRSTH